MPHLQVRTVLVSLSLLLLYSMLVMSSSLSGAKLMRAWRGPPAFDCDKCIHSLHVGANNAIHQHEVLTQHLMPAQRLGTEQSSHDGCFPTRTVPT